MSVTTAIVARPTGPAPRVIPWPRPDSTKTQALDRQLFLVGSEELMRPPRPMEIAAWRRKVTSGEGTVADLRREIAQSREAVLVRVYTGVTGKRLTPGERARWLALIPRFPEAAEVALTIQKERGRRYY